MSGAAEAAIRGGHPWVYSESVKDRNREGEVGELAVIFDRKDRFLAVGLFDPDSPLQVRVIHVGKPRSIDASFWREKLTAAISSRRGLFDDTTTTGYRVIHGENDGWPGLVLDRYGETLVVKLYSAVWLTRLREVTSLFQEVLAQPEHGGAKRIVLRLSRNIQGAAAGTGHAAEGQVLFGPEIDEPVIFLESRLRFEAEVQKGQKTGFYLDQRENRRRVESMAEGGDVLNAFSFSGGFSLYAARGGARSVTDLDISEHALASARRNFQLNRRDRAVARCKHQGIQAEAFEWLASQKGPAFDLVILDPPTLARREADREGAIRAYERLAKSGLRLLRPGGRLLAASCSAHVRADEFFEAVRRAMRASGKVWKELGTTGHPADHPARFAEAEYLKCIYLGMAC